MKIFVSRKIADAALELLRQNADVRVWEEDCAIPPERLRAECANADGLLCMLTDRIDAAFLDAVSNLKVLSTMAVGYDNIDIAACSARRIPVGHTPGVLTDTTADLAFALILATARRMHEAEQFLRAGKWTQWSPNLLTGADVHGATLGIVGMGRIGYEVARRAFGFRMNILYHSRSRHADAEQDFGAVWLPLNDLLAQSDFVSLHTPLSAETRHLIGAEQLAKMKPTAFLINTARGAIVDEVALANALRTRTIAGAGLDVFTTEPLPADSPLLDLNNAVLVPHIGSATVATRTNMALLAAKNLLAGLRGEPMPHCINKEQIS
jgi:glyoxylate reductase